MASNRSGAQHAFDARIKRLGSLYCLAIPGKVSRAIGVRGRIPVVARVAGGAPFRATLMPSGGGKHHMIVNGEVRRAAGAKLGELIAVEVRIDWKPREVPLPHDLATALRDEGVLASWESLPAGKREHIIKWIDGAAHEATREKRVSRAVQEALVRYEKQIDRLGP
jgi:hypothetical protein